MTLLDAIKAAQECWRMSPVGFPRYVMLVHPDILHAYPDLATMVARAYPDAELRIYEIKDVDVEPEV